MEKIYYSLIHEDIKFLQSDDPTHELPQKLSKNLNSMHHTMAVNSHVGGGRFLMVDVYGKIMTCVRRLLTEGRE
jgi:hypothetical protein